MALGEGAGEAVDEETRLFGGVRLVAAKGAISAAEESPESSINFESRSSRSSNHRRIGVWKVGLGVREDMDVEALLNERGFDVDELIPLDAETLLVVAVADADEIDEDAVSTSSALKLDQSSLFSGTAAALMVFVQAAAFSLYRTSLADMTKFPLIQMLNPPSLSPGVFNQMSCRMVVQSPRGNVQAPRPMERPYSESQTDLGGVEHSEADCLSFGTY